MAENNIPDINSGNIDTIVSNGVTPHQAKIILDKLSNITDPLPNNLDKVRLNLREISSEKNELSEETKKELKKILLIVESKGDSKEHLASSETFSELNESVSEKSKIIEKLFSISDIYFNDKLKEYNLSNTEKENAKLVLWDNLINKVNFEGGMGLIVKSINGKISELFNGVDTGNGKKDDLQNISTVVENLTKIQDDLLNKSNNVNGNKLFRTLDELLGFNLINIEKSKKSNIKFDTLEKAYVAINGDTKDIKTFDDIKNNTLDKAKSFDGLNQTGDQIKGLFEKLPADWGNQLKEYLKEISNQYPILGFIIGMFFGEGFLDSNNVEGKNKKSLINLATLVEKSDTNSKLKKFSLDELKNLEPKKLESFFKYLEGKEIDYNSDDFWKVLLTGETKDVKLLKITEILKSKNGNILDVDGEFTNEKFINKLNNISDLESNYNQKIEAEELKKLQEQKQTTNIQEQKPIQQESKSTQTKVVENPEQKVQTTKVGVKNDNIQQSQREIELLFNSSIRNIKSLPSEILYKGENVKLSLEENNIVLGKNKYKISLLADIPFVGTQDVFKGIDINNGNFEIKHIRGHKEISKDQLITVLNGLLEKQSYSLDIPNENAKLDITKIA